MPPPEKTPSAMSAPRSGVDGASSDMLAACEAWAHRLRALAVEDRHLLLRVALAGDGVRRDRPLDRGHLVLAELQLERPQRLVQALGRARADEGHDVLAAREHPRDRKLRYARAIGRGDRAQLLDQREVAPAVRLGEARRVRAEVARIELALGREVPADEPPAEHAVRGDRDPERDIFRVASAISISL